MYLFDTCTLLWWTLDPEKLSKKAAEACREVEANGGLLSSISLWETGTKIQKGKLHLGMSLQDYLTRLKEMNLLEILPVDEALWLLNLELKWNHRDPVDRTIVATAMSRQLSIITADEEIQKFYKKVIW